ncbi:glycosyltransferase [Rhodanobacter hydrolyticus]|uniref:Glycosyltransferase n=1 Tax=Rhodanobacter hydrolyticus TaxID=2250595 RepID=A0ABW8J9C8_9GAMM
MTDTRLPLTRLRLDLPKWATRWLLLGMWWLVVGMAASPVGDKVWNPGKPYHMSLLLLFALPAVWWMAKHVRDFMRQAVVASEGPLLLVLLAWIMVSSLWANYGHVGDATFVVAYIALFVFSWAAVARNYPLLLSRLLYWGGIGLACAALVAMAMFPWRHLNTLDWRDQGRVVAFGLLNNPNIAAYAFGAAIVWMMQVPVLRRWQQVLRWLALAILATFVLSTDSRASWLAILAAVAATLLTARGNKARLSVLAILAAAAVAVALGGWRYLVERGLSYRPEIFSKAWRLIEQHPWRGLGMGSEYTIQAGGQVLPHSHNVLTHMAIMSGIPGLLLALALWLLTGWRAWCHRNSTIGGCLLALWVYTSVALQFDTPDIMLKPDVNWLLFWLPLALGMGLAWRRHDREMAVAMRPRVSLIVLTYNWPAALARVLQSVAAQTRLPDEVIVADDGSGAETRELIARIARDFPVPLRHAWQEDLGFRAASCRNLGIAMAKGDYVILIDGDMILHRDFVADHLLLASPGCFLQGGRFKSTAQETAGLLAGRRPVFAPWAKADFHVFDGIRRLYAFHALPLARWKARRRNGGRVMSCNMSFWRDDLLRVNGFDERMEGYGAEDRELAARLGNAGVRRKQLKWAALAAHLEHDSRAQPDVNDMSLPNNRLFHATVAERITRCEFGVDRHMAELSSGA